MKTIEHYRSASASEINPNQRREKSVFSATSHSRFGSKSRHKQRFNLLGRKGSEGNAL